jgi:hypothetical protein
LQGGNSTGLKALIATAMAMAHGQKMAPAIALRVPMILDFSQLAKVEVDRRRSSKDRRLNLQPRSSIGTS